MTDSKKSSGQPSKKNILPWVGVFIPVVAITAGFYFLDGNFHNGITPKSFNKVLSEGTGGNPGFRHAHAKGVCARGTWNANPDIQAYSKAQIFTENNLAILGRFALGPTNPFIADANGLPRSFAINFKSHNGERWVTGMNNTPVIPMSNAKDAYDVFKTGFAPDKIAEYRKSHPWVEDAFKAMGEAKPSTGFANEQYNGVNSFILVNEKGQKQAVRWSLVPSNPPEVADDSASGDKDYLFKTLIANIKAQPLKWNLVMTLASDKDDVNNPSKPWDKDDKTVTAGTVTIDQLQSENGGECLPMSFDPTILPQGIELSGDPIPKIRSAIYMRSFYERAGQKKAPSEVTSSMINSTPEQK